MRPVVHLICKLIFDNLRRPTLWAAVDVDVDVAVAESEDGEDSVVEVERLVADWEARRVQGLVVALAEAAVAAVVAAC